MCVPNATSLPHCCALDGGPHTVFASRCPNQVAQISKLEETKRDGLRKLSILHLHKLLHLTLQGQPMAAKMKPTIQATQNSFADIWRGSLHQILTLDTLKRRKLHRRPKARGKPSLIHISLLLHYNFQFWHPRWVYLFPYNQKPLLSSLHFEPRSLYSALPQTN